jgi:hypothetical protein
MKAAQRAAFLLLFAVTTDTAQASEPWRNSA